MSAFNFNKQLLKDTLRGGGDYKEEMEKIK